MALKEPHMNNRW